MYSRTRRYIEVIKAVFFKFFGRKAQKAASQVAPKPPMGRAKRGPARDLGLPALSGTGKQKSWAGVLRAEFVKKAPEYVEFLKTSWAAKPAAGWIQNRDDLAAWLAGLMIAD